MAIRTGDIPSVSDFINGYITNVYNPIINGAYHSANVPKDGIYNMIQPERLGNLNLVKSNIDNNLSKIGTSGGIINASILAKLMIECTRILTKVGTWSYVRSYKTTIPEHYGYDEDYGYSTLIPEHEETTVQRSASGKALFSDSYIKSLIRNPSTNVTPTSANLISATGLNSFYADLLSIWQSTSRHANSIVLDLCHGDCHSDCHDDCHSDDCYK